MITYEAVRRFNAQLHAEIRSTIIAAPKSVSRPLCKKPGWRLVRSDIVMDGNLDERMLKAKVSIRLSGFPFRCRLCGGEIGLRGRSLVTGDDAELSAARLFACAVFGFDDDDIAQVANDLDGVQL